MPLTSLRHKKGLLCNHAVSISAIYFFLFPFLSSFFFFKGNGGGGEGLFESRKEIC